MDFIRELRDNAKWPDWRLGISWLCWSMLGGLLPVWGGWFVSLLFKRQIGISNFADSGEFALYSASFLSTIFFVLFKDFKGFKDKRFPSSSMIGITSILLLLLSTLLFGTVRCITVFGSSSPDISSLIDLILLRRLSISCFLMVIGISFLITVADNLKFDISKETNKQYGDLEKQFDGLNTGSKRAL